MTDDGRHAQETQSINPTLGDTDGHCYCIILQLEMSKMQCIAAWHIILRFECGVTWIQLNIITTSNAFRQSARIESAIIPPTA